MGSFPDCPDERRLRLLDAMPAIAWCASAETFRFTYVNRGAETLLGYPVQRWLDEPDFWIKHLHPEDQHVKMICHNETLAGRNHELVYRMIAADGRTVWLRDYVNVHQVDGVPVELFGVMVDVTREREAERTRATVEAKFRWLVEQSVVSVYMMAGTRLTYINNTGAKTLGYTADELTSIDFSTLFHEEDRPAAFDGGASVARVWRKDGMLLHLAIYQHEVTIDGERMIIGTSTDITENVRDRQALEASEQRYRELVEDVTDILYTLDQDGRFVSLSRSFERSTGYSVDEWIGRPFGALFTPRSTPALMDEIEKGAGTNAGIIHEYDLPARSGAVVTVEVSSQPRYVDGVVTGTIGMARDVTEHRTIARKLEEAKRMSSLGQVAASLAHEFNNVLMGIQPFVELIADNTSITRDVSLSLGHIRHAISRGRRASQEILRFANPKEPQLSTIDTRVWLPTLLGQLMGGLPSSIAISSSIDPAVRFILGDREHLEQVITNLVFNARDAITGNGTIHVGVSLTRAAANDGAETEFVRISLTDDGPGIEPPMLDKIFEPLFTTKRNGTGLGLAIARRLMDRQGGTITAENRAEGGATFHLLVPSAAAMSPSIERAIGTALGSMRILLVEDDLSVGAGLAELLKSHGHEMTWVRTAAEACTAARQSRPHVAIIDVNLPDANGVDLIPVLRAEHAELPVVLSTGHVEFDLSGQKTTRTLSLMKPYELSDLLTAIGNVTAAAA